MASTGPGHRDAVNPAGDGSTSGDQKTDPYKDVVEAERAQSPELQKSGQNYGKIDKELAQYVSDTRVEISEAEDNRLRRLIDKRILAIMITTYFLQAIDKGTMSFASIMGIVEDTNLHDQESVCQPAFVVLSSTWYKREEQTARVTYWYMMNGAQQMVGGLLAYCFSLILPGGPLLSWQWLFLAYGVISVIYGAFVGWWMPDSPMRAKCFSEEDKKLMIERVRSNQTGVQNKEWKKHQAWEGIKDPQAWGYALIQLCTTLPTSGLGSFQGIIIKSFGFTTLETQLLAMVLGAYIIIVLLSSAWLVKKTGQNLLVMLAFVVPSFIGTICLMTVPLETMGQKIGLVICYYITLSFWSAQTLALSMVSRNIAGQTKKSVVVALNFVIWSAGNAIGPQVFLKWDEPRYFIAFATHLGCYSLLVIVIIFLRFYLVHQNKKRDALAEATSSGEDRLAHAFEDLTDKENPNFRYVY